MSPLDVVIVTGAREYTWKDYLWGVLTEWNPQLVIEGGANGADYHARAWCYHYQRDSYIYRARWAKEGKAAGFNRNRRMLSRHPDVLVLAFVQGASRGTRDCIKTARELKHHVIIHGEGLLLAEYQGAQLVAGNDLF